MNCHEFTSLLDEHGLDAITAAARAHADACAECARALAAAEALAVDGVPPLRPAFAAQLLDDFDAALSAEPPRRRAWRSAAALGALALGGLAFAGIAYYTSDARRDTPEAAPAAAIQPPRTAPPMPAAARTPEPRATSSLGDLLVAVRQEPSLIDRIAATERAEHREFTDTLIAGGAPDGEYFPVLKVAPIYPAAAAAAELEGYAIVEFVITERGDVADITIVESSDPVFEAPTIAAAAQFKYKPRVVDGRPQPVAGVRNRFQYQLEMAADQPSKPAEAERDEEAEAQRYREFRALLDPALTCLEAANLRCIELELEQIAATRELNAFEQAYLDQIAGFVHFRRGNFQQAIDAYSSAAPISGGYSHMTVARIYYEQGQYQQALDAAVRYLRTAGSPTVSDYAFVDKLRQLGATVR